MNDKRVVYSVTGNRSVLESPELTGELFYASYDGSGTDTLFGSRSGSTGSHIQKKEANMPGVRWRTPCATTMTKRSFMCDA